MSLQHHRSFDTFPDNTSELGGGISFNARMSMDKRTTSLLIDESGRNIPMIALAGQRMGIQHNISTQACQSLQFVSESVQTSDLHLNLEYYQGGRRFRSIGTSTSPERYGLVRTAATNTSPSLSQPPRTFSDVADSDQSIILQQVENGVAVRMAVIYLLASKIKR